MIYLQIDIWRGGFPRYDCVFVHTDPLAKGMCALHQYSYNFLVGTCTGLYKPVQALKVESLQEKQAMSDFPQV